jgi:RNA polymerase sigma factor (TIGR02999 family)
MARVTASFGGARQFGTSQVFPSGARPQVSGRSGDLRSSGVPGNTSIPENRYALPSRDILAYITSSIPKHAAAPLDEWRNPMNDVTRILSAIDQGDPSAANKLLPLVYDELRKLAAQRLAQEKPGQTLQATALVHEAYLRLVGNNLPARWNGRGHFFAAAAEAMRRILVENARRRARTKHGGDHQRQDVEPSQIVAPEDSQDLLALDEALNRLSQQDSLSAELVKLRYFAGLTIPQAAEVLGVSPRKADFLWSFARAWLRREIAPE